MKYTKVPLVTISDDDSDEDEIYNRDNGQQFGSESCIRLIDVDGDGRDDILLGAASSVDLNQVAVLSYDVKKYCALNSTTLWMGDDKNLERPWNIYQAAALPDFDGDGVPEVLISHGGDPTLPPQEHNRKSGRLIVFSGATGKSFGERYLNMPENKETYMSPVIYTCKDGSQYIFFGSGGETVPGDLMIISVPDFYRYVMHKGPNAKVPGTRGAYNHWPKRGRSAKGILTLFNTPAPGYFNDDDTLDFMLHWSTGEWPFYNHSIAYVINGKDGKFLWSLNSSMYEMSSDLVLQTKEQYRDMYLFRVKGRTSKVYRDSHGAIHGVGVQRNITKRHRPSSKKHKGTTAKELEEYEKDYAKNHYLCSELADANIKAETFLMDRSLVNQPIKALEYGAEKYTYGKNAFVFYHYVYLVLFMKRGEDCY
ncbi:hypothetical protein KUTeg_004516 [Tegillarca granosa]|uniref:FG-GAP repeat protein n=1 Tax=Tegillarca granosa TaxID=220873 RepID=A0ABQ9FUN4_TEGGR|nr:hypothetical protein KUTeg_004516 [Tegillarca granosa]